MRSDVDVHNAIAVVVRLCFGVGCDAFLFIMHERRDAGPPPPPRHRLTCTVAHQKGEFVPQANVPHGTTQNIHEVEFLNWVENCMKSVRYQVQYVVSARMLRASNN